MTTLEKIRAEIANLTCDCINGMVNQYAVLQIFDKYAEQEKYCQECVKADDCVEYGTINCKWRVVKNDL